MCGCPINHCPISLPNLIIAGVNKAGTTSLFSYLALHPDICTSSVKETCYFNPLRYGRELLPFDHYRQYFGHCNNQKYVIESTPGYFYGGSAVARGIKEHLGDDVKILIVFREPIARLLSFYKFQKSKLELDQSVSLAEYIRTSERLTPEERREQKNNAYWGIEGGFYSDYLPAWYDTFGKSVKIVFFEYLRNDPRQLLQDLCEWLHIDHTVFDTTELHIENKTFNYKNRFLHRIARNVNDTGEKFWRSRPHIKRLVRRVYCAVNGKPFQEDVPDHTLEYLESVFRPYNRQLAIELSQRGHVDLPNWLAKELQAVELVKE